MIKTEDQAIQFLTTMQYLYPLFHPEDDPMVIEDYNGNRTFNDSQVKSFFCFLLPLSCFMFPFYLPFVLFLGFHIILSITGAGGGANTDCRKFKVEKKKRKEKSTKQRR